jgi:hypothetical protein
MARFILINKRYVKDISQRKYPKLELIQYYILFSKAEVRT